MAQLRSEASLELQLEYGAVVIVRCGAGVLPVGAAKALTDPPKLMTWRGLASPAGASSNDVTAGDLANFRLEVWTTI